MARFRGSPPCAQCAIEHCTIVHVVENAQRPKIQVAAPLTPACKIKLVRCPQGPSPSYCQPPPSKSLLLTHAYVTVYITKKIMHHVLFVI